MNNPVSSQTKNQPVEPAAYDYYETLIKEVYVDPIRSVIVVDDEFPTLDALVDKEVNGGNGWSGEKKFAQAIKEILTFCRERERPWLVDVHDGRVINVEDELHIARHLHHSDLMILDYHLLGEGGTGDKAISILRNLACNHHFNMVVVYTKGYDGNDIPRVFDEISAALTHGEHQFLSKQEMAGISELIAQWEDSNEGIAAKLGALITRAVYVQERSKAGSTMGSPVGGRIKDIVLDRSAGVPKGLTPVCVLKWLLQRWGDTNISEMSKRNLGPLSFRSSQDVNWIKTDSLFVTVVDKRHGPAALEGKLISALKDFFPGPHQLLMAKMRAQIDDKGVVAEAAVLNDKYIQTGWLMELFGTAHADKTELIKGTVDRHWEALGDRLRVEIEDFATKLVTTINGHEKDKVVDKFVGETAKEVDKVFSHLNLYNSTKPVSYSHLATGQIFIIPPDGPSAADPSIWICLTPICDLVPGQKKSGWYGKLGEKTPFMAAQLMKINTNTALENVQDNIHLFLKIDDKVGAYTFCPSGNPQASPVWEQMFVSSNGRFIAGADQTKHLVVTRVSDANGQLVTKTSNVSVVAQLRYEYALNLLQRLSGTFSRIGLDFRSRPNK